ncbi:MAG TPA: hypothetical protein VJN01_06740, partial [Xanthomonadales bacterium]|nr:hypothetical protein [Xanthomonadales bacterium]
MKMNPDAGRKCAMQRMQTLTGHLSRTAIVLLFVTGCLTAQAASFEPTWGRDGMVVTSVGPAAAAGQMILERG